MLSERVGPRHKLFFGQPVTLRGVLQTEQAITNCCDELGLASNDPPNRICGREILESE